MSSNVVMSGRDFSAMTREELIRSIENMLGHGEISMGQAVVMLRTMVARLDQRTFAKMCKISIRTLAHIEHEEGNQTIKSMNAVFKPFGLELCPVRVKRSQYVGGMGN
ncbi:helix-turn-helix domain-containing protein [Pseudomonas capsici]|uniref:Transcriptional regulator n=1 Tax=Pseudomonas capsici TaxID=2810614 RepID=A0ABT3BYT2_9PSED|nr:transcriptional regulator [Pseudomonas capsici]MCV4268655.1 transcriptional regulator [Pseudomonas capsici]MCV4273957.1 transcriptional regulator [Pseudomonas capsici]MCV4279009.1 transcriptional regulator [Pseudomonas capsici]MCV4332447.1 transcriptional regulator [Pseudomonas capsici]MCV4377871.1 transcriptional regulator [Pseudomonas capsici]